MLQNAYFLAKVGADTAENEQHFAESLPKIGNCDRAAAKGHGVKRAVLRAWSLTRGTWPAAREAVPRALRLTLVGGWVGRIPV